MAPTPCASAARYSSIERRAASISSAVGENTSLAIGTWLGMDRPLAVEAEQAPVRRGAPVAVGVLVRGERRVDRVDAGNARGGDDLRSREVPEVAGVLAHRIEVAVDSRVL